jgi:UDP-glucose 4-epimerase
MDDLAGLRGARVLVTGGAGFIGSHLVERLVGLGAEVTIVDSLSTGRLSNLDAVVDKVELVQMDLIDDRVRSILVDNRFRTVFHLAGNAHVTRSVEDPASDFQRNVVATISLLEALRSVAPMTRLVFTSSAVVYGDGTSVPIRETDRMWPASPYGASKLACEHYIRLYASLYRLRTATACLFSVYGPRLRKQVVYDLMCKLLRDPSTLPLFGDGTQVRDMNHVANIADALLAIDLRGRMEGERYNVASGEQVSMGELARMVCEASGLAPEFRFTGDVRPGETQAWYPDTSAMAALGYRPRLALRDGIADTVRWFDEVEKPCLRNEH